MMTIYSKKFKNTPMTRLAKVINIPGHKWLTLASFSFLSMLSINSFAAESDATYFSSASFLEIDWDKKFQEDIYTFDGQWLYGSDYNKLAILVEGELLGSDTEGAEIQLLYSKYLATFWDARIGIRQEIKPESEVSLVIGVEGLAPYWFDVGASLYLSENGDTSAELELAYEMQLTQQLVMQFYTNTVFNGYSDQENNVGSGLAENDYGIQLRYEFNRHVAVYLDWNQVRAFGDSKDYLISDGENYSETGIKFGLKIFNF